PSRVPDQVHRSVVVLQRLGHRRQHALGPVRQRRRWPGGHHVDVHPETAAGERAQEALPDVREIPELAEAGGAQEARDEEHLVDHGHERAAPPCAAEEGVSEMRETGTVASRFSAMLRPLMPTAPSRYVVAVVGAATAGAEAAAMLAERGVVVVVFEQNPRPYGKI